VSKLVTDELQVSIRTVPDTDGVHWKTASGASLVGAQLPASVLRPDVLPVNVPPLAGSTVGRRHASLPRPTASEIAGTARIATTAVESRIEAVCRRRLLRSTRLGVLRRQPES